MPLWQILFLLLVIFLALATAAIIIWARRVGPVVAPPRAPALVPAPWKSQSVPSPAADTIHVELFDAEELIQFQPIDLPPDRLPDSFEAATTMHLGDRDFEVVEARPMTAAEFTVSKKLRLVLREVRIEKAALKDILYSLPTIDGALPGIAEGSTKLNKQVVEIHEDDWRQVEFVAQALQEQIDEQLRAVQQIYDEERVKIGFRKLHVRESLTAPLAGTSSRNLD